MDFGCGSWPGAQPLINDVVSGFFIIFENQYLVGDIIESNDIRGSVTAIDFRTTQIRDYAGRLHVIRNGDMRTVTNYSRDYINAIVDCTVGPDVDLERVLVVFRSAADDALANDEDILETPSVVGITDFDDANMTIRMSAKVKPGCHFTLQRVCG